MQHLEAYLSKVVALGMDNAVARGEGERQPVACIEGGLEDGGLGKDEAVQHVTVPGGCQVELPAHRQQALNAGGEGALQSHAMYGGPCILTGAIFLGRNARFASDTKVLA